MIQEWLPELVHKSLAVGPLRVLPEWGWKEIDEPKGQLNGEDDRPSSPYYFANAMSIYRLATIHC